MARVSVCMAMYNGSSFVNEQVYSILDQLRPCDELIICDDASIDDSVSIVTSIPDVRINVLVNPVNLGHIKTFERAINHSTGDIIFISDQDDVWLPGRLQHMISILDNCLLCITSFRVSGLQVNYDHPILRYHPCRDMNKTPLRNLVQMFLGKRSYFGCAMAFRRQLVKYILPFPSFVENYDLWIATVALLLRSCAHSSMQTLIHRIHSANFSFGSRPLISKVVSRLFFLPIFAIAIFRVVRLNHVPVLHSSCLSND